MEDFMKIINSPWFSKLVWSLIIIVLSMCIYSIITRLINRNVEKKNIKILADKKAKTYVVLIKSIIRYTFVAITVLVILQTWGVNINSVLAGVGVLGVTFGLAIQDWLKDVIRGSSILSDKYFSVGDIVKYGNVEGKVLELGLKTTKIQDLRTNNVISIANRKIEEIQLVSNVIYVKVPLSYDVKMSKAEKIIEEIVDEVSKLETNNGCVYKGVSQLADSSILYLLQVSCSPINKLQAERDTLRTILLVMENNKVEVPYNQLDIHQK